MIYDEIEKNNFKEDYLGYSQKDAIIEAERCLQCLIPNCILGCPVQINIPKFIFFLKNNSIEESYNIIFKDNVLPSICGRVCTQETQCELNCILYIKKKNPINIGKLERYISDNRTLKNKLLLLKPTITNNKKIAIVGSGPSSITVAIYLRLNDYNVTIYEALNFIGGVLLYGIPNFRLPKKEVELIYKQLKNLNVEI